MILEYKLIDKQGIGKESYMCIVDNNHQIAFIQSIDSYNINLLCDKVMHIASYNEKSFLLCRKNDIIQSESLVFRSYRDYMNLETCLFDLIARASMISHFMVRHQYCGACSTKAVLLCDELCIVCPNCHQMYFPSMDPCIIVAVKSEDKILLAKNKKSTNNMYSVVAGYVELGETLEAAVKREVFEECGVLVDNIRYVESQSWAMPNSLMMAFTCDYVSGDVIPDGVEIVDAAFFKFDDLPLTPQKGSIAHDLIEFCHTHRTQYYF